MKNMWNHHLVYLHLVDVYGKCIGIYIIHHTPPWVWFSIFPIFGTGPKSAVTVRSKFPNRIHFYHHHLVDCFVVSNFLDPGKFVWKESIFTHDLHDFLAPSRSTHHPPWDRHLPDYDSVHVGYQTCSLGRPPPQCQHHLPESRWKAGYGWRMGSQLVTTLPKTNSKNT